MAALDDATKDRVRYHLEYPLITQSATSVASVVMFTEVRTQLEAQMNAVSSTAQTFVTRLLDDLDSVEVQMIDARSRMRAREADVVTLNANEEGDLWAEYVRVRNRLCNLLAVRVNPYTNNGMQGLNFRVGR